MITIKCSLPGNVYVLLRILSKSPLGKAFTFSYSRYDRTLFISTISPTILSDASRLVNIGSGGFILRGALNLDLEAVSKSYRNIQGKPKADFIPIDINDRSSYLGILDSFAPKYAYCSHTLEHVYPATIKQFMVDMLNSLASDGVLRIVLPSYSKYYRYYKSLILHNSITLSHLRRIREVFYGPSLNLVSDEETQDLLCTSLSPEDFFSELKMITDPRTDLLKYGPEVHLHMVDKLYLQSIAQSLGWQSSILGPNQSVSRLFRSVVMFDHTDRDFSDYIDFWNS